MNGLALVLLLAAAPDDAPLRDRGGRFRFGFSAQLGIEAASFVSLAVGGDLRLGVQVRRWLSVFGVAKAYQTSFGSFFVLGGVLFELMAGDHVAFAAGPVAGWGRLQTPTPFTPPSVTNEPFKLLTPGWSARIGVSTGASRPPTFNRFGLNVTLELVALSHSDLRGQVPIPNVAITRTVRVPSIWTFVPMLGLGFDWR